jgi:hypothetical protein
VAACKQKAGMLAGAHANLRVIDFLNDGPISRPENFWDDIHYRGAIARQIEDAIARARPAR